MSSNSFMGNFSSPGNVTTKGGLGTALGNQYGINQSLENQTQGQRNTESGSVLGGYEGLVNGGGYSPQEKESIEQGTLGGINNSYNSANDAASRRLATTHNSAGYGQFAESEAQNKARDMGQAGLQVQSQFANEAYQRKLQGLQGLQQMYGVDTNFLSSLGQQQQGILGIGNSVESRRKGKIGDLAAGASAVGSVLSV